MTFLAADRHQCWAVECSVTKRQVVALKPNGHYIYRQFNIQQFYVLPTQCVYVFLRGPENKQRLFPYTALTDWFV